MLLDARSVPDGSDIETELCIVGAGAAGITLALELAGSPLRVTLLESGGLESEPKTQALYRGRVFGRRYFNLDAARTRRFGGSTNCWQGICAPLSPIDFEAREWVENSGWPFAAEELEPFYVRARRICGLPSEPPSPNGEGASALSFKGSAIETRLLDVHPRRFGQDHRDAVTRARNVHAYLHANAIELEMPSDGGRNTSVRVATLEGGRFSVRGRGCSHSPLRSRPKSPSICSRRPRENWPSDWATPRSRVKYGSSSARNRTSGSISRPRASIWTNCWRQEQTVRWRPPPRNPQRTPRW